MNQPAHSDHGTVLQNDQAALVINPDGSFALLLPHLSDEASASLGQALIVAIAVKLDDPEWVEETLAALDAAPKAPRKH
ncbi:MAG: hypothetical protein J0H65_04170 [Rhizobiales bacterium]|nr:hypothetical protein [Hyphomicrobiales bacterium]